MPKARLNRSSRPATRVAPWVALALLWALSGAWAGPPPATERSASSAVGPSAGGPIERRVWIDDVWAGTGVTYDAIAAGPIIYVAYYNAERRLTVSRVDTRSGTVRRKVLNSVFNGWDAHNYTTLALDSKGHLHVAGNMHTAPLVYARTAASRGFGSLALQSRMIGRDEASVTYPRFFRFPDGDLGFTYRSGRSGSGVEIINRFDGERWRRVLSTPLFASAPGQPSVNAYHTGYELGPDGYFHTAWVWREPPGAEMNFNVNYAKSRDLVHWQTSSGRSIELPITPANAEVVDAIPTRSGLLNNLRLGFDQVGRPVISYLKYDAQGNSQLVHARPMTTGWQVVTATTWDYRWNFSGGGTLVGEIVFTGVSIIDGQLVENVSHKRYGRLRLIMDPVSLEARTVGQPMPKRPPLSAAAPAASPPFRVNTRQAAQQRTESVDALIRWESLGSDNNDRPRTCASSSLPEGCRMTRPLELFVR